jgi:hypothetical protein
MVPLFSTPKARRQRTTPSWSHHCEEPESRSAVASGEVAGSDAQVPPLHPVEPRYQDWQTVAKPDIAKRKCSLL